MYRIIFIVFYLFLSASTLNATLTKEKLQSFINTPLSIGKKDSKIPVWEVLDKDKKLHSYIFQTYDYAQIPGFSGEKINLLVQIDLKGNFLDIAILEQNEPVFVSGLGVEPFIDFLKQYKGKSLKESIKIRAPRAPKSPIHIDGVTKATITVYIANDLILGSAIQVAKEKLFSSVQKKIYHPKKNLFEKDSWKQLLDKKLIKHIQVTKKEMEKLFVDTQYQEELDREEEEDILLDLYLADISIPTIANNLLSNSTLDEIRSGVKKSNEAILVFANGPYNFITDDFIPGTSPDQLVIKQDNFSLNILDGNYDIEFLDTIPNFSQTMLLEVDKRYNFDPSSSWTFNLKIQRGDTGVFSSPIVRYISKEINYPKRYFDIPKMKTITKQTSKQKIKPIIKPKNEPTQKNKIVPKSIQNKQTASTTSKAKLKEELKKELNEELKQKLKSELAEELTYQIKEELKEELKYEIKQELRQEQKELTKQQNKIPFWLQSIYDQNIKLITLTLFLTFLFIILYKYQMVISKLRYKRTILLTITLFYIGWFSQGQLSIVTVLGVIKNIYNSSTLTFLLYDPFGLIIWFFVFLSLFIWGRGTFCGWLCPYGVLQEFSYYIGRVLRLPKLQLSDNLNNKLVYLKYLILALLILSVFFAPDITKYLVEIEPFKTSITLIFDRELPYVLYALFWIVLGMFLFKGFCRYFCPLGAFLSLAGKLRILDWLPRRVECGNPCNNCFKHCNYQAIDKKDGHIKYTDCFQCLDCVEIYSDENLCKVLKKDPKKEKEIKITKWSTKND